MTAPAPELLTRRMICERIGISRLTWFRWVRAGKAPQPVPNIPGVPRWSAVEIDRFIAGIPARTPGKRLYFNSARRAS